MGQMNLGLVLVRKARRCWDLTAAVPEEYEAGLWAEGERLIDQAALFGDNESIAEVAHREERRVQLAQLDLPHDAFW